MASFFADNVKPAALTLHKASTIDEPLAFVNGYAETLDVLIPNLANHESLRRRYEVKYKSPLAAQPRGMGKTMLGLNIPVVLRHPREADVEAEARVAERLRSAQCWGGFAPREVDAALRDTRDENLVVRTLLACFPSHEDAILRLKHTKPLLVRMGSLKTPDVGWGFHKALAYAVFCEANGLNADEAATVDLFLGQDPVLQSVVGAVRHLLRERKDEPLLLILDDIHELGQPRFEGYLKDEGTASPLRRAMLSLQFELRLLHGIPRCFIYSTGCLLSSAVDALGFEGQLVVKPTLIHPLTDADILETLAATTDASGHTLLSAMGVAPSVLPYFASRVQALTGGIPLAVQRVLRARQREVSIKAAPLKSPAEVDAVFGALMPGVEASDVPGFGWSGLLT